VEIVGTVDRPVVRVDDLDVVDRDLRAAPSFADDRLGVDLAELLDT